MLLSDGELVALHQNNPHLITNLALGADPYGHLSPIQPSSIDLSIGNIFLPEVQRFEYGEVNYPLEEHFLKPGHTAVVETLQTLNLPNDIAAFGFPPASVSAQGLLMTNPGHIDPGYSGRLCFTVINMGQESFHLKRGASIVTLLIFRLQTPAQRGYGQRNPQAGVRRTSVIQGWLSKLSADFRNIERRAEEVAQGAERKARWQAAWFPLLGSLLAIAGVIYQTQSSTNVKINELEKKLAILEERAKFANYEQRLKDIEEKAKTTLDSSSQTSGKR